MAVVLAATKFDLYDDTALRSLACVCGFNYQDLADIINLERGARLKMNGQY